MIDFSNYKAHPTSKDHLLLFFDHEKQAAFFEELLLLNGIFFEKDLKESGKFFIYYAINKCDFDLVKPLNEQSNSKFRKPFIPDKSLRYTVLILFFTLLILALTGLVVTQIKSAH
jgi:hypothetical protein